jgi:hypothetical protein
MNRTNKRFTTAGDKKTFPRKGSIASAMSYAKQVAAEFKTMESGYRNSLYSFLAHALTSYHNFRDWSCTISPAQPMRLNGTRHRNTPRSSITSIENTFRKRPRPITSGTKAALRRLCPRRVRPRRPRKRRTSATTSFRPTRRMRRNVTPERTPLPFRRPRREPRRRAIFRSAA